MQSSELLRLAGIVFGSVTFIVVGDTSGKLLTANGVDPFVVAWSRFGLAALIMLPFSGLAVKELKGFLDWRVLVRSALIAGGISCILTALKTEPIPNVFGAFFVGPIVSYILAILFLGETPSRSRSLLLAVGFIGVLMVVKPGFGASTGMFFALAAGTFYGSYLAMTRTVAGSYRPRFLLISQLIIGSIILTPFGLSSPMPVLNLNLSVLIALSALGSAIGNYLIVVANRKAEASLIAPLVYSQLISATVAGVLVFGDWPDMYSLMGLGLILISGFGSMVVKMRTF
ncbi:MAG: DMT family transporter [Paracoccaceae bacterium]|nr:DMT family transporter [Paracoccaceae bacterium]MDG2257637.1 DMT family transporter [Paracoccaceae bacterium]